MSRDWLLFLDDLIQSAEKIARYLRTRSREDFVRDEILFDAVLFNLSQIGEAVKHLPEHARASQPDADWHGPTRMRDLIAHHYFSVDPGIAWDAARVHVPRLLEHTLILRERFDTQSPADTDRFGTACHGGRRRRAPALEERIVLVQRHRKRQVANGTICS